MISLFVLKEKLIYQPFSKQLDRTVSFAENWIIHMFNNVILYVITSYIFYYEYVCVHTIARGCVLERGRGLSRHYMYSCITQGKYLIIQNNMQPLIFSTLHKSTPKQKKANVRPGFLQYLPSVFKYSSIISTKNQSLVLQQCGKLQKDGQQTGVNK